jgi:membrane-associated phospholipid phosphatase
MRVDDIFLLGILLIPLPARAGAQPDSVSHISRAWIAPAAGVATAAVFDSEIREWSIHEKSSRLDRLAKTINPLGTGRVLVPAMAATYLTARLVGDTAFSRGTMKVAGAYLFANIAESILKPAIGRERPHLDGNPRKFRPFTSRGDWHSLPSAHVAHITAIVSAVNAQSSSRTVSMLGDLLIALVSFDRVYEDQHWASDVAFTVALTPAVSRSAIRFLDSHFPALR